MINILLQIIREGDLGNTIAIYTEYIVLYLKYITQMYIRI